MHNLLIAAREYKKLGISPISTDANKRSLHQWKKYQDEIATDAELKTMFTDERAKGIAILSGKISGNMEVIDIDCKYDITGSLYEDYIQRLMECDQELVEKLVVATTKSGGYHVIYRCDEIGGNTKLAQRHTTEEEKERNPHEKRKVLIETRGEAGYVVAVPTEGYKYVRHSIRSIPTITPEQRSLLLDTARSFNSVIDEVQPAYVENKPFHKSPFSDYNERGDVIALLQKHGWKLVSDNGNKVTVLRPGETTSKSSGDYNREMNLFSVFTTSTQFEANKGYRPAAVYALLECENDFKLAARRLLQMGYGKAYTQLSDTIINTVRKYRELGYDESSIEKKMQDKFNVNSDKAKELVKTADLLDEANAAHEGGQYFWDYDAKKKLITIRYKRFAEYLMQHNFALFFFGKNSNNYVIVHSDNNRLTIQTNERMKKYIEHDITKLNFDGLPYSKDDVLERIYANDKMFSEAMYEFLQGVEYRFLRDTKDEAFIPFHNGIVRITKDDVTMLNHGDIDKIIWATDVIDFQVDIALGDNKGCEFLDFLYKATGQDAERLRSAISITGYLLHKYKNPAKSYAVILAEETEDETKGGGTGKGLFIKGLERILNTVTIDGKNFKPDKSFAYQRVKADTKLISIQDLERTFNFEKFYSIITEGLTIEKKNMEEVYLAYEDSPKVILTTNYTINDDGNHAKRRQRLIEFGNYFNPKNTPLDEYQHLLFDEWDRDEWNRFYNFMFYCLKFYLMHGIVDITQKDSYRKKKIRVMFGEEFLDWFEGYVEEGACQNVTKISDLYQGFLSETGLDRKDFSLKRFKKGLMVSSENFGYKLSQVKMREDHNRIYVNMIPKNGKNG